MTGKKWNVVPQHDACMRLKMDLCIKETFFDMITSQHRKNKYLFIVQGIPVFISVAI